MKRKPDESIEEAALPEIVVETPAVTAEAPAPESISESVGAETAASPPEVAVRKMVSGTKQVTDGDVPADEEIAPGLAAESLVDAAAGTVAVADEGTEPGAVADVEAELPVVVAEPARDAEPVVVAPARPEADIEVAPTPPPAPAAAAGQGPAPETQATTGAAAGRDGWGSPPPLEPVPQRGGGRGFLWALLAALLTAGLVLVILYVVNGTLTFTRSTAVHDLQTRAAALEHETQALANQAKVLSGRVDVTETELSRLAKLTKEVEALRIQQAALQSEIMALRQSRSTMQAELAQAQRALNEIQNTIGKLDGFLVGLRDLLLVVNPLRTPTPTATLTPAATSTPTSTPTPTATASPRPTMTPWHTATPVPTQTTTTPKTIIVTATPKIENTVTP